MVRAEYRMPELIRKYYLAWVNGPTLLEHPLDKDRFFRFVKACIRYSRQQRHGGWLRYFLENDLQKRYTNGQYSHEYVSEIIILFERLLDFNKVSFPEPVLEMRNPYEVKLRLQSYYFSNGRAVYTTDEIERILRDNFGSSWEKDYRRKYGLC